MVASSSGNYNQGSGGAVTQTITGKLQQGISVKDFGAMMVSDHTAANEKLKAIAQVLASFGLLDAVPKRKQEKLLKAIYEILDAPGE